MAVISRLSSTAAVQLAITIRPVAIQSSRNKLERWSGLPWLDWLSGTTPSTGTVRTVRTCAAELTAGSMAAPVATMPRPTVVVRPAARAARASRNRSDRGNGEGGGAEGRDEDIDGATANCTAIFGSRCRACHASRSRWAACWPLAGRRDRLLQLFEPRLDPALPCRRRRLRAVCVAAGTASAARESIARSPPVAAGPPQCEVPFPAPRDEGACDPPAASPDAAANRQADDSSRPSRDYRPGRDARGDRRTMRRNGRPRLLPRSPIARRQRHPAARWPGRVSSAGRSPPGRPDRPSPPASAIADDSPRRRSWPGR